MQAYFAPRFPAGLFSAIVQKQPVNSSPAPYTKERLPRKQAPVPGRHSHTGPEMTKNEQPEANAASEYDGFIRATVIDIYCIAKEYTPKRETFESDCYAFGDLYEAVVCDTEVLALTEMERRVLSDIVDCFLTNKPRWPSEAAPTLDGCVYATMRVVDSFRHGALLFSGQQCMEMSAA